MKTKVAINGFGRIGRLVLRAFAESEINDFEIVAINDLGAIDLSAHLFQFDSVHGTYKGSVTHTDTHLVVDHREIRMLSEPNPEKLPWKELGIDIVLECSGIFTQRDKAMKHLTAGAKKVLISAPANDADLTVVYGVNHQTIKSDHAIVSNASCTTNCLAPLAKVLNDKVGIEHGFMTTIHAYTGDQRLVDSVHSDPRRARAGALSMIPTSTGAAKAVGLVLPELKGKLDGTAIRVPTANVSVVDFKFVSKSKVSIDLLNSMFREAAKGALSGILSVNEKPLVSIDFNHNSYSSVVDLTQTQVIDETFCRVLSWYDNEWGFSNRMLDVTRCLI